jgi:hypothetical protein
LYETFIPDHLLLHHCQFFRPGSFSIAKSRLREVLLLIKDGNFIAGDDPAWAKPGYDDSNWEKIDPTDELHHLPR